MDKRIRKRRREVARGRGRHRLALVALVLVIAGFPAGWFYLRSSDCFTVTSVVAPASSAISAAEIKDAVRDVLGLNLLVVSAGDLEERLSTLAYVRRATVVKRYPHTLELRFSEYEPAAVIEDRCGRRWLAADDGRVLREVAREDAFANMLPLVVAQAEDLLAPAGRLSVESQDAVRLALEVAHSGKWPANHPVSRVEVDTFGETLMVLRGGAEIRLGTCDNLDEKLMVAVQVIDRYLREGESPEYVDVRVPWRVVAKKRNS